MVERRNSNSLKTAAKVLFLATIMLFSTAGAFAQFGSITISSANNQKFWLFIDDVLQNEYSMSAIRIQGMQLTYYKVRVEMDNQASNCVGETVLISNVPNGNNYVVTLEKTNVYSFKPTRMMVNPFFVQNVIVPDYNYYSAYNQFLYPGFNPNANYGQGNQKGSAYKKNQQRGPQDNHGHGGNQGYGNQPPQGNQPPPQGKQPIVSCMPTNDFNRALSVIQKESFEDSKLKTAQQMTSANRLCVSQIMQICNLFSFEKNKLEYAKFAYRYCADPNNYYQVNEVFSYSSSKDELRKFIGN